MKNKLTLRSLITGLLMIAMLSCSESEDKAHDAQTRFWPEVKTTMKPWTRWWWMGNAVDKENITKRLEEFALAGIGGVEITPIYGVKGYEDHFLRHLSPEWMDMLIHTIDEADRLGMGVDMVLGTGWPFGGPQVEEEYAAGKIYMQTYPVKANEAFRQKITYNNPERPGFTELQYVFAFDADGKKTDLASALKGEQLEWTPEKDQVIFAIFNGKTGQQVKRAAPGGEGHVLDHFSADAMNDYLEPYEKALSPVRKRLRAVFNDSYEVYDADYTPSFLREFRDRRSYDFTDYLPLLASENTNEDALLILGDYRETLSDLVLEDMSENWAQWATANSFLSKYQAHGCPGNLLDIYASADIPECESFYATSFDIPGLRWEESDANQAQPDLIMLKFASSAAHISGKPLSSSETLTWLREHFKTALSQCKPEVEQIFLSGVNHVFFHGSTYSPDEAAWPGWKFYASVNFVPSYTIWKDAPFMFDYITRCQSILQSGESDNEILVYWPFHDVINADLKGEFLLQLGINNKDEWLVPTTFHKLVRTLLDQGYSVDFISDDYLVKSVVENGRIRTPGRDYSALVIPDCRHMPLATMESLIRLATSGGKVVFEGLPETVPGFHQHEERSDTLRALIAGAEDKPIISSDITASLSEMGIRGESITVKGLEFVRRKMEDGKAYYLVNHTPSTIDGFINLQVRSRNVLIMDPLTGKSGLAKIKRDRTDTDVYIQMKPGETIILRTFDKNISSENWKYSEETGAPVEVTGTWDIEFLSGGPALPDKAQIQELTSWTHLDNQAEAFSGTARYTIRFENPDPEVTNWQLNLGDVRESARVKLNGEEKGCLWSVPFKVETGMLKEGVNTLEIEVTNLSANRLRDLELRGIEWKIFYEINMVNRHYEPFDATSWDPMPSGLLGKVSITPLREKSF